MKKLKILILLKKHNDSGGAFPSKAGLFNSARFLKNMIERHINVDCELKLCVDANSIDKEIYLFRPDICIIEAIWAPPYKLAELTKLWPKVLFIVRVHSKTPFLANEGVAIKWIKEYNEINNVLVSFNDEDTNEDFNNIGINSVYLPNLYPLVNDINIINYMGKIIKEFFCNLFKCSPKKPIINIGCFGAIRPLKNQLNQAIAAIEYADKNDKVLHFHINGTRVEQKGENVLKNIRALFFDTRHKLIEHSWLEHHDFLKLVKTMNSGLQVSFTESFNIVSADFVYEKVPIVTSTDIDWTSKCSQVDPNNVSGMVKKIKSQIKFPSFYVLKNYLSFKRYYYKSITVWKTFLNS